MQQDERWSQEKQWLEQVDMSLTDKQCHALGWQRCSVLTEMLSFLCMALVSCMGCDESLFLVYLSSLSHLLKKKSYFRHLVGWRFHF
ncbi:hypothetical protein REH81_33930 [Vibrio rotiferianus]